MKRRVLCALALASATALPLTAQAQAFPNKPIRIVVPYAAGGTTDMLARVVGRHMSDALKVPVVVENKPGANGMLGSSVVAKSAWPRRATTPPTPACTRTCPMTP